jgi:hypothetical protein
MKKLILIPILFLSYFVEAQYVVVKPSQLPAASTINLTDLFILNQGTTTKKVTYSILNTVLKDTFLTKKVTLDSIAALRGDIGSGGSQWTTTPLGISYPGAIFPGSIKKWDAVADTFLSIPTLASGKFGFYIITNNGFQNYININEGFQNHIGTNEETQNSININNSNQNSINTNNGNQNYININEGFQNHIETNNLWQTHINTNIGTAYKIDTNTGTGLNFSGTGKHIRMTSTGTDTTEVFNQTSTGLNQVFRKNSVTKWKVDGDGLLYNTPPHCALYKVDDLTITATQNIWYKITGLTVKDSSNMFFRGDSVQLKKAGSYQVNIGISFSGLNNEVWEVGVFKSGSLELPSQLRTTNTSDVGEMGIPVYIESDGDDWFSFRIRNTTDGDDPTIKRFSAIITAVHLNL